MKNLPRVLRTIAVLVGAMALGVLFNRSVIPLLSRDVGIWVIHGMEGRGCEGSAGATLFQFGRPVGQSDGVYKISCDEVTFVSEAFALLCTCP